MVGRKNYLQKKKKKDVYMRTVALRAIKKCVNKEQS